MLTCSSWVIACGGQSKQWKSNALIIVGNPQQLQTWQCCPRSPCVLIPKSSDCRLLLSSLSSNQKLWRTIGFAQALRRLADPKRQSKGWTRSMGKKNSIRGQENIGFRLLWFLEQVARKCSPDSLTAYNYLGCIRLLTLIICPFWQWFLRLWQHFLPTLAAVIFLIWSTLFWWEREVCVEYESLLFLSKSTESLHKQSVVDCILYSSTSGWFWLCVFRRSRLQDEIARCRRKVRACSVWREGDQARRHKQVWWSWSWWWWWW